MRDERLRTVVRQHIERVVAASPTKVEAARRLGLARSALYKHLAAYAAEDRRAIDEDEDDVGD